MIRRWLLPASLVLIRPRGVPRRGAFLLVPPNAAPPSHTAARWCDFRGGPLSASNGAVQITHVVHRCWHNRLIYGGLWLN